MPPGPFAVHAPRYFEAGVNVVPIVPGEKKPAVPWRAWQRRQQTSDELDRLVSAHGTCDVGIVLGGLVDFDVDSPAGEEALVSLAREKELALPPTAMFTSRRGAHRLYRCASRLRTRRGLRPQLDMLAAGSYVVAPTSGGRQWLTSLTDLAPLPTAWEDFLRAMQRPEEWRPSGHAGAPEGERNTTLSRLVGSKLTAGVAEADILRWARDWAMRCPSGAHPFTPGEAEKVARSIIEVRRRTRSPTEAAMFLARERHLDAGDRWVFVALVAHQRELGGPETFAAPCRLIGSFTGLDPATVARAYRRLRAVGLIALSATRSPDGRRVTTVRLLPPLHSAT
jgi:hypothetical protein